MKNETHQTLFEKEEDDEECKYDAGEAFVQSTLYTWIITMNMPHIINVDNPKIDKKWFVNGKTIHKVGENICQLYIRQRTDNQNIQGARKTKLSQNK
jgi:hypothetical protein